jgi:hypothetical protein
MTEPAKVDLLRAGALIEGLVDVEAGAPTRCLGFIRSQRKIILLQCPFKQFSPAFVEILGIPVMDSKWREARSDMEVGIRGYHWQ